MVSSEETNCLRGLASERVIINVADAVIATGKTPISGQIKSLWFVIISISPLSRWANRDLENVLEELWASNMKQ